MSVPASFDGGSTAVLNGAEQAKPSDAKAWLERKNGFKGENGKLGCLAVSPPEGLRSLDPQAMEAVRKKPLQYVVARFTGTLDIN